MTNRFGMEPAGRFIPRTVVSLVNRRGTLWASLAVPLVLASPLWSQAEGVQYRIRVPAGARHVEVSVLVPQTATRLFMDSVQADHLPNGWGTFVRDFRVRAGGQTLEVRPGARPTEWHLPPEVRGPIRLDYRVTLEFADVPWPAGNEQAAARLVDGLYVVGRALFIDSDVPGPRQVTFEVPSGWRVSAPWRRRDTTGLAFEATDGTDLMRNSLVFGTHASIRVSAGPLALELALPGEARAAAPLVEPALRRVARAYLEHFPDTPPSPYLMTFFRAHAEDGEAFVRSAAFTTADSITADGLIIWGNFLAHELFHFWNGQRIRGAAPRSAWRWMAEGFTEYYANVTLAREAVISQELFLKKAERHLGNYLYFMTAPAFPRISLADAGVNTGANRFAVYDGGWAVAFCLDGLIRERSGDRASLDDFMRALWRRFRSGAGDYTVASLDALADELAGASLGGFLTRYTNGLETLPLRGCLERVGLAGAFKGYAAEAFLSPGIDATPAARARGRALFGAR